MKPSPSRTARIFLSSTFRDFGEERDLLVRRVFPALRARLKDRFVELVDVDLRWGITVEQAERGEVLPICLAEIDRSRPFFVGLLGERYGWVPEKGKYSPELVEQRPWLKKHQGGKSVTELEILHGVLNNPKMAGRALFYFRSSAYAKQKGGDYLPQSPDDRNRQKDLKARIRESGFPVVQGYKDPEALAKRLERDLWKILDEMYPADEVPDAFTREGFRHEAYAVPRRRLYLGGEGYVEALDAALGEGKQRILVEGASGGGKSALIANWLEKRGRKHRKELVHVHYLGATAEASDPQALVRRLVEAIKRLTKSTEEIPSDPQALYDSLSMWLSIAHAYAGKRKTQVLIVLDALNGLRDLQDLRWFPEFLPDRVRMVVSCLPGTVHQALLTKGDWQRVEVTPLDSRQARELFVAYLRRYNKELPEDLLTLALSHQLSTNPLFLRTLAEELRLFGVHERLKDRLNHYLTSKTVDDLFERVLERVESDCGAKQVRKAMEGIWASRAGLSEHEIHGFANLKPAEWAPIRHALDDSLLESGGRITFAHDYMRLAVSDRHLAGNNTLPDEGQSPEALKLRRKAHIKLARWFDTRSEDEKATSGKGKPSMSRKTSAQQTRPADARSAEEVPWQYQEARDWKALKACLTRRDMFEAMYENRSEQELLGCWLDIEAHTRARIEKEYEKAWMTWKPKKTDRETADLAGNLSSFLEATGRYKSRLIIHLGKVALRAEEIQERRSPSRITIRLNDLALAFQHAGNLAVAERLYRKSLDLIAKSRGNRATRAATMSNLATLLFEKGEYREAEKLLWRALDMTEKALGSLHPDTGIQLGNLAEVLEVLGRRKEALPLLHRALEIAERTEGAESQDAALRLAQLAGWHISCGDYRAAEQLYQRAYKITEACLGGSHPSTANRLRNLADVMVQRGEYSQAEIIYRKALKIFEVSIGRKSTLFADVLNSIGMTRYHQGDYSSAMDFFAKGLIIAESNLGSNHPDISKFLNNMALVSEEEDKVEDAEIYYRRSLHLTEASLGYSHPSTAVSLNNLALFFKNMGDYASAEPLYRRALTTTERVAGAHHADTATKLNNLGLLLEAKGDYKKAERYLRRAYAISEKSLGKNHPDTANRLNNLASALIELDRRSEAIPLFLRALSIFQRVLGPEHPTTLACADNVGFVYEEDNQDEKAEKVYKEVIGGVKSSSGLINKNLMRIHMSLGDLMKRQYRISEADKELSKAVTIAEKIEFGGPFFTLAELRIEQKQFDEAAKLLRRCLEIRRKRLDPTDEVIAETIQKLVEVYRLMGKDAEAEKALRQVLPAENGGHAT
jgi:nephrocystin-3